jgi:hypothetical protein
LLRIGASEYGNEPSRFINGAESLEKPLWSWYSFISKTKTKFTETLFLRRIFQETKDHYTISKPANKFSNLNLIKMIYIIIFMAIHALVISSLIEHAFISREH